MTLDRNDPVLTAYALGELPEDESRLIEQEIARDPQLQEEVDAIRQMAETLKAALKAEPLPAGVAAETAAEPDSDNDQRPSLPKDGVKTVKRSGRGLLYLAAASVLLLIGGMLMLPAGNLFRQTAMDQSQSPGEESSAEEGGEIFEDTSLDRQRPVTEIPHDPRTTALSISEESEPSDTASATPGARTRPGYEVQGNVPRPLLGNSDSAGTTGADYGGYDAPSDQSRESQGMMGDMGSKDGYGGQGGYGTNYGDASSGYAASAPASAPALGQPVYEEFYAGGRQTIRGLEYREAEKKGQSRGQQLAQSESHDDSLQMMVKPRVVPQKEEEERLGLKDVTLKRNYTLGTELNRPEGIHFYADEDLIQGRGVPLNRLPATPGSEAYIPIEENDFIVPDGVQFSTFSIDVDTASYANMRRFISGNRLPPPDSVRIEELINYFDYDYAEPEDEVPFATHVEIAACPWAPEHQLAKIGIKGREIKSTKDRPPLNLVFLLDVSGSMSSQNKLPLVKQGMTMLVEELRGKDHVAIVVYAGSSGLVLPPTSGKDSHTILDALERLKSGGSTAGEAGIRQAYSVAREHFEEGAVNRVILCTDGDFNVGVSDRGQLVKMIEEQAKSGVFLTVLGFGMGNLKDGTLEQLADKGNGNYGYIDTVAEARKVLVDELSGTMVPIAKDVKIQVDFNPREVGAYRLIGYVNRKLADEDFHDDTKDAGEIGAGHTVTALYEIIPPGVEIPTVGPPPVDRSRYADPQPEADAAEEKPEEPKLDSDDPRSTELLTVKLRYKLPTEDTSSLLEYPIEKPESQNVQPSRDFEFASSVALFGMLLRGSAYLGDGNVSTVLELAQSGKGEDGYGYRAEFIELVKQTQRMQGE